MTTFVALTVAIAGEPTAKPRSSTASVEINETPRNGPHCNSTLDMILSESMLVTNPVNLLRADEANSPGTLARPSAAALARAATSVPATTWRPLLSFVAVSLPWVIHRRTESSETPRYPAASEIRKYAINIESMAYLRRP